MASLTSWKMTSGERDALNDLRIRTTDAEVYRNVTILLMLGQGRSKTAIAKDMGCGPSTVDDVVRWYCQQGEKGVRPKSSKRTGGNTVILNVTNRCNYRCRTCLRGSQSYEDVPVKCITRFLEQGKALGVQNTVMTGGEPILHPHFDKLVALHDRLGLCFGLVNNGSMHEKYCQALAAHKENVRFIAVSLDGHNAEINDKIRQPGGFDRAIAAIQHYLAEGYQVRVSHILNKWNVEYMTSFMKLMEKFDVRVNMGFVIANRTNRAVQLDKDRIPEYRARLRALTVLYRDKMTTASSAGLSQEIAFCPSLQSMHSMTLQFDGEVMFCCDLLRECHGASLGNINKEPLKNILPRYGRVVGRLMEERIGALVKGKNKLNNNCDLCNKVLLKEIQFSPKKS
jgi:MoaA/NifB/PqqE/SkfB family radical SAM enzyme